MEAHWTVTELQGTRLKDRRRVNTFIRTAAALYQQPQASLSAALGDGLRQAAGDLFRHRDTRVAALLASHGAAVAAPWLAAGRVIVAQDTTYFTYHQAQIVGLGPLNGRAQGLVGHSALALSPEGLPLGVLAQRVWGDTAHPLPGYPIQLEPEVCACESAKWIVTLKNIQTTLPKEIPVLVVADREADLTAYLRAPRRPGVDWLIRAVGTRTVHGSAGATGRPAPDRGALAAVVAAAPVLGEHQVAVPAQPAQTGRAAQPARTACVTVRVAEVTLPAQRGTRGRPGQPALPLWAIEAWEADPPAGTEPLRWLLLTTLAVPDFVTAIERIKQYRLRGPLSGSTTP